MVLVLNESLPFLPLNIYRFVSFLKICFAVGRQNNVYIIFMKYQKQQIITLTNISFTVTITKPGNIVAGQWGLCSIHDELPGNCFSDTGKKGTLNYDIVTPYRRWEVIRICVWDKRGAIINQNISHNQKKKNCWPKSNSTFQVHVANMSLCWLPLKNSFLARRGSWSGVCPLHQGKCVSILYFFEPTDSS
jgi:hypothetical protein